MATAASMQSASTSSNYSDKATDLSQPSLNCRNSTQTYDFDLDYFQCFCKLLRTKHKVRSREKIEAAFPLFCAKFSKTVDLVFRQNITFKQFSKREQPTYDGKVFAQATYDLFKASAQFDSVRKRQTDIGLSDWTAWYEEKMQANPEYAKMFTKLMRSICDGKAQTEQIHAVMIASIDAQQRGQLTYDMRHSMFSNFVTNKGIYASQIQKLNIQEEEWNRYLAEFFAKGLDKL